MKEIKFVFEGENTSSSSLLVPLKSSRSRRTIIINGEKIEISGRKKEASRVSSEESFKILEKVGKAVIDSNASKREGRKP